VAVGAEALPHLEARPNDVGRALELYGWNISLAQVLQRDSLCPDASEWVYVQRESISLDRFLAENPAPADVLV